MHYNGPMIFRKLSAVLLAILALAAMPSQAERPGSARAYSEQALSLDEAVAQAERRYSARAVKAESKKRGERSVYRIRLLAADGRVFDVTVDAETGAER